MDAKPTPSEPSAPKPKSRLIWWLQRGGIALAVLIVLLIVLLPSIVRAVIRHELQAQIGNYLNATVEIGDLAWHPLLGVTIDHARLLATNADGTQVPVAELTSLNTGLASMPFGGPLVVSDFVMIDPTVNLIQLPSGEIQIEQNLLKPQPPSTSSSGPMPKPSTIIQVKHFKIQNMRVQVLDEKNLSSPGVTLLQLDVEGHQTDAGPGAYDVHIALAGSPLIAASLDTSSNLDGADVSFKNFSVNVTAPASDALAQLPPQIASFIKDNKLAGAGIKLTLADGAAITVDMQNNAWKVSNLDGKIELTGTEDKSITDGQLTFAVAGSGPLPGASGSSPGTLTLTADANYQNQPIHIDLAAADAADKLSLTAFHLNMAEGTVVLNTAELDLTAPYHYAVDANYQNLQISDLKQFDPSVAASYPKLAGLASGKVSLSGTLPPGVNPLTTVQGSGSSQVTKADLWDVPMLGELASKVNPNFGGLARVGEADVAFTLGNSSIHFSQLEATSPILGVMCTGDVGLTGDNQLDIMANVAAGGDWQKNVNSTGVPGISALGSALGNAQGVLNKASVFHVTGPAAHPNPPIPAAVEQLGGAAKNTAGTVTKGAGAIGSGIMNLFQPKK